MLRIAFAAAVALAAAGPAHAQAPSVETLTEGGRYALLELNDAIVRLDTDTGVFSLCRMEGGEWSCTVTVDERKVLEDRIADLTRRIEVLERPAAPAPGPDPLVVRLQDPPLPTQQTLDPSPAAVAPAAPAAPAAAQAEAEADLPPLAAPQEVSDRPVPLESMADADAPEPEKRSWMRRAAGLLPFVD